jgi:hypothetical protein
LFGCAKYSYSDDSLLKSFRDLAHLTILILEQLETDVKSKRVETLTIWIYLVVIVEGHYEIHVQLANYQNPKIKPRLQDHHLTLALLWYYGRSHAEMNEIMSKRGIL